MGGKAQEILMTEDEQLDWIQMRQDFDASRAETTRERMIRKINENPFVPIGCVATASALGYGLWNFRTGNRRMSQLMMRTRIAAQGFTIAALVIGVCMTYSKK